MSAQRIGATIAMANLVARPETRPIPVTERARRPRRHPAAWLLTRRHRPATTRQPALDA